MIRIAVCDDENVIVNQIEHIISEVCKRESIPVNIDVFYSGRELKRQVTSGTKYDIIFLDIQMKGGDGITAAENIRKVDDNVLLIYVSGKAQNRDGVFFILHLAHWCDMMKTRNPACIF